MQRNRRDASFEFRFSLLLSLVVLSAFLCAPAFADIADDINAIRERGCENRPGIKAPFRKTPELNEVAREWSRGGRLRDAIKRTEHRLATSSSMHVSGSEDDAKIVDVLADNYCDAILDESFSEIGVYRSAHDVWVVVATRHQPASPGSADEVSARALELVNAARAKRRTCGSTTFQPAPPLKPAPLLEQAALAHARDMARHSSFSHTGSDGSRPADRVTRTGYPWRNVAENIAAAAPDVETVVQGWLDSPGHCTNIMGPQFKEMGIAYVVNPKSKEGIYWAQVFGTRR